MYEKEVHATEGTRELYYINTPSGISAILESTSSYDSVFYIHTDILGSYDVITDDQGGIRERLSFDPWGRRRNTSSWDYTGVPAGYKFDKGFTGHEHLDDFGLINMNGRVYDPIMAMFLSPDPFIQSPHGTQNFNRYAYCLNNPLLYFDPSGFKIIPVPEMGKGVYYDDVEDRYIFYGSIIGREAKYFGHGYSAITTMPGYRSGGLIYKVDSYGEVEYGYYANVSYTSSFPNSTPVKIFVPGYGYMWHLGEPTVVGTRPVWIPVGTSNLVKTKSYFGYRIKYGLNIGYHSPFGKFYIENGKIINEVRYDRRTLEKMKPKISDLILFRAGASIPLFNLSIEGTLYSNLSYDVKSSFGPYSISKNNNLALDYSFGLNFFIGGIEAFVFDSDFSQSSAKYLNARQSFSSKYNFIWPWR
jgi:RHS repeat-associated protein